MIQPVNALTPKVFKGYSSGNVKNINASKLQTRKNTAIANAVGISAVAGAFTSIVARSYTTSWKNAFCFGVGASLISMMFICPPLLYKSGFYTHKKEAEADVLAKKLLRK